MKVHTMSARAGRASSGIRWRGRASRTSAAGRGEALSRIRASGTVRGRRRSPPARPRTPAPRPVSRIDPGIRRPGSPRVRAVGRPRPPRGNTRSRSEACRRTSGRRGTRPRRRPVLRSGRARRLGPRGPRRTRRGDRRRPGRFVATHRRPRGCRHGSARGTERWSTEERSRFSVSISRSISSRTESSARIVGSMWAQ